MKNEKKSYKVTFIDEDGENEVPFDTKEDAERYYNQLISQAASGDKIYKIEIVEVEMNSTKLFSKIKKLNNKIKLFNQEIDREQYLVFNLGVVLHDLMELKPKYIKELQKMDEIYNKVKSESGFSV